MASIHETNFHSTEMSQNHAGLVNLAKEVFQTRFDTRLSLEPIDRNPLTPTENIRVAARTNKPLPEFVIDSFFVVLSAAALVQDTYKNQLTEKEMEIIFNARLVAKVDPIRIINRGIERKIPWAEVRGQLEAVVKSA